MSVFKAILFDLFFVISAFVGVGFATGKELENFFAGGNIWIGVAVFFCLMFGFSLYILHVKNKYLITNITQLNKLAFGKYYKISNVFLLVLFIVTSSAMLSGCDNIMQNVFEIKLPIFSFFLSIITFFTIVGGIKRIKSLSTYLMPILIAVILINVCGNFKTFNASNNIGTGLILPVVFFGENCVTLISVLIKTKSKPKVLSSLSAIVLSVIILFSVFAIGGIEADMPMLTISKNLGGVFFAVYLIAVLVALFITLQISSFNAFEICLKRKREQYFISAMIVLTAQSLSFLGFTFIVKYMYSLVGVLGGMYLIALIIRLVVVNKKIK